MSTYWYLACEDCNRYVACASTGASGVAGGLAGDTWLRPFAVAHAGHTLRVVSEHNEDFLDFAVDAEKVPTPDEARRAPGQPRGSWPVG